MLVAQFGDEIADLRPHVVVTYDPNGGYGHPDHIQAHRVTTAAVVAAAGRWAVPKFYWTVTAATVFRAGLDALEAADVAPEWIAWPADATYGYPDDQITAVVEAPEHLPAKISAMLAHATQMTVGPTGRAFTLSNNVILPVVAAEHYVLVSACRVRLTKKVGSRIFSPDWIWNDAGSNRHGKPRRPPGCSPSTACSRPSPARCCSRCTWAASRFRSVR